MFVAPQHSDVRRKTCHPTKFTAIPIYENEDLLDLSVTIGNTFQKILLGTGQKTHEINFMGFFSISQYF